MLEAELFAFLQRTADAAFAVTREPGCGATVWILLGGRAEPGVL